MIEDDLRERIHRILSELGARRLEREERGKA